MSIHGHIPKEILASFRKTRGFRLLVKGEPGTGKTLFVLTLCKSLKDECTPFYITTRVTPEELYTDYPFIRDFLSSKNILDAVASTAVSPPEDLATVFKFSDKPAFLQQLYAFAKSAEKPALIVIDSLEALKSNLNIRYESFSLEEALFEVSRDIKGNLVFVSEKVDITPVDYMVDGIVVLGKSKRERLIRYLQLVKIRGIEIENPTPIFTLINGEFRTLHFQVRSFYDYVVNLESRAFNYIKSGENFISTGIKYLDKILDGGYWNGTLNLVEIRKEVGDRYDYLYLPTIINHILNEKSVFIVPPAGIPAEAFKSMLTKLVPSISMEKFNKLVKIVRFTKKVVYDEGGTCDPCILNLMGESIVDDYEKIKLTVSEIRNEGKPALIVLGLDTMQQIYGEEELSSIIGTLVIDAKQAGDVLMCLVKYGQRRIIDVLNHLADMHFVIDAHEGTVLTYGVIPYTPNLHPNIHVEEGKYEVKLTPIV